MRRLDERRQARSKSARRLSESIQPRVSELLSIVVPVYNEEATVGELIERLLAIELPVAREILVINDGSTDGTRSVLNTFPDHGERLRIVHATANGGKGTAIRIGLDMPGARSSRFRMRIWSWTPRSLPRW